MRYRITSYDELVKAFKYAKRQLENSKFGIFVDVTKKKQQRSLVQNNYYHGVLVAKIGMEVGYKKENYYQVHEALKEKFCPEKETPLGMVKSTKMLNTAEMEEYHNDIRLWFADEYDYELPLPNEV